MSEALNEAIKILFVGMTTVFFILTIVVFVGNILIVVLNKTEFILNNKGKGTHDDIPDNVRNVITRAVTQWSKGKAKVTGVKKS